MACMPMPVLKSFKLIAVTNIMTNSLIKKLDETVDVPRLTKELKTFLTEHQLQDALQISLTRETDDSGRYRKDDWFCSVGRITELSLPEETYSTLNESLAGTYISELITTYNNFYRWRILSIPPNKTYTVHSDALSNKINKRIHIPVITNDQAFFCFYDKQPANGVTANVSFHHLDAGNIYEINTSGLHSAINYGTETRYHIVGVRYEEAPHPLKTFLNKNK